MAVFAIGKPPPQLSCSSATPAHPSPKRSESVHDTSRPVVPARQITPPGRLALLPRTPGPAAGRRRLPPPRRPGLYRRRNTMRVNASGRYRRPRASDRQILGASVGESVCLACMAGRAMTRDFVLPESDSRPAGGVDVGGFPKQDPLALDRPHRTTRARVKHLTRKNVERPTGIEPAPSVWTSRRSCRAISSGTE